MRVALFAAVVVVAGLAQNLFTNDYDSVSTQHQAFRGFPRHRLRLGARETFYITHRIFRRISGFINVRSLRFKAPADRAEYLGTAGTFRSQNQFFFHH